MAVNVPGLIAVVVFYAIILATGIWASRKTKQEEKRSTGTKAEVALIAGRNINLIVGIFTMTATWVGGGYIMGTAAAVYNPTKGLVWALMPVESLIVFLMGGTMSVILDLSSFYSICISATVAIIYTLLGGMFSVAYTDVIQLVFIFISLWLCVPFLMLNPTSTDITLTAFNRTLQAPWVGKLDPGDVGLWLDDFLVLSLGGLAYQAVHQRILSAASSKQAQVTCFAAAGFSFLMGIPSVLVGAVAASTDWNMTSYGSPSPYDRGEFGKILPIALQHLTPDYISIMGIGAVAAAVMSSMDSCLLSSASLFTNNMYKALIRKQASDREIEWVIKTSVLVFGLVGMGLAFLGNNVLAFWIVSTDLIYAVVLPQLICILFFPVSNVYGAVGGYFLGALLRLLSGEPLLYLPPVIHFPGCRLIDGVYVQHFPCRTLAMLLSLCAIILISYITTLLFEKGLLPKRFDVLQVRTHRAPNGSAAGKGNPDDSQPAASDQLLDTKC